MKREYPVDPEKYDFKVVVPVQTRFGDFDAYGHANNGAIQSFYDLGRAAYLEKFITKDFFRQDVSLLVVSYTTDFLRQIKFGEQVEVRVAIHHIGNKSLGMLMAIVERATGAVCSVSSSVMAGFDRRTDSSAVIPTEWREKIGQIEGRKF